MERGGIENRGFGKLSRTCFVERRTRAANKRRKEEKETDSQRGKFPKKRVAISHIGKKKLQAQKKYVD